MSPAREHLVENLWRGGGRPAGLPALRRDWEESRLDDMADPASFGDLDENDPRAMARWMRRMSAEMGEDLGDDFGEVVDRLEAGESPESIEESMPDSGAGGLAG